MKKTLIALVAMMMLASSSFAGVSYLTAPSVGVGNWAVLGMYGTNHVGTIANNDSNPSCYDVNNLGVRGEYGVMKDVDLLLSYTFDTLPNIKDADAKQTSGSTWQIGGKYALGKQTLPLFGTVVDTAVAGGYQVSSAGIKADVIGSMTLTDTTLGIGYVISKQMDNLVPYGAISYKMVTESYGKGSWDSRSGNSIALNMGCMIGIAKDKAIAVEYNTENQTLAGVSKPARDDANGINVSGISLGYVCMF